MRTHSRSCELIRQRSSVTLGHQFGMVRSVYGDQQSDSSESTAGNRQQRNFSSTTRYTGSKRVEAVFSIRRDAKSPRYEKKTLASLRSSFTSWPCTAPK